MDAFIGYVLNKECTKQLLVDKVLSSDCQQLIVSKILGYTMSFGACFYKLPVLINMCKSKSGDGLNIYAVYLETSGYGSWMVYNILKQNSWSVYGDLIATTIQNFLIILLVWCWGISGKKISTVNIIGFLAYIILYITVVRIMPPEQYFYIANFAILVTILSRLPQIVSNAYYGKVGVQSPITLLNGFIGASVKLFVSFVETKDIFIIGSSILSMLFNLILFAQVIYYSYFAPNNAAHIPHVKDGNEGKKSTVAVDGVLTSAGTQKSTIKTFSAKRGANKSSSGGNNSDTEHTNIDSSNDNNTNKSINNNEISADLRKRSTRVSSTADTATADTSKKDIANKRKSNKSSGGK